MAQYKILVVDDEKNIRLMLSQTLGSSTRTVETAVNGEDALQKLERTRYDLMLVDLRMPGMDGVEVLRQVQSQYPQMPVIMLTAHGTVESAVEVMRIGAVNFLQKPFSPREIREVVDKALQETKTSPGDGPLEETLEEPEVTPPDSQYHDDTNE